MEAVFFFFLFAKLRLLFFFTRDYQANAILDQYETNDIDDTRFAQMDLQDRTAAEEELARRDAVEARRSGRLPAAFVGGDGKNKKEKEGKFLFFFFLF